MKDWNQPKPHLARYRVEFRPGKGHVVLDPEGRTVSGPTPFRTAAETVCAGLQLAADRKAGRGERACLCCGKAFFSAGRGNRLCKDCRGISDPLGAYGGPIAADGRKTRRAGA